MCQAWREPLRRRAFEQHSVLLSWMMGRGFPRLGGQRMRKSASRWGGEGLPDGGIYERISRPLSSVSLSLFFVSFLFLSFFSFFFFFFFLILFLFFLSPLSPHLLSHPIACFAFKLTAMAFIGQWVGSSSKRS